MFHRPQKGSWNYFAERAARLGDFGYAIPTTSPPSSFQTDILSHSQKKIELQYQPWIEAPSYFLLAGVLCSLMHPSVFRQGRSGTIQKKDDGCL